MSKTRNQSVDTVTQEHRFLEINSQENSESASVLVGKRGIVDYISGSAVLI